MSLVITVFRTTLIIIFSSHSDTAPHIFYLANVAQYYPYFRSRSIDPALRSAITSSAVLLRSTYQLNTQTKKVVLRLECTVCKVKHQLTLKRTKHFELGGDKKQRGQSYPFLYTIVCGDSRADDMRRCRHPILIVSTLEWIMGAWGLVLVSVILA